MAKKIIISEDVPWEFDGLYTLFKQMNYEVVNNEVYTEEMQELKDNINNHYLSDDLNNNIYKKFIKSSVELLLDRVKPVDMLSVVIDVKFDARLANDDHGLQFALEFLLPAILLKKIIINHILILSMYPKSKIALMNKIVEYCDVNNISYSILRKKIDFPKYDDSFIANIKNIL